MDHIRCEVRNGVALVTLARPEKLNAFAPEMFDDIQAVFDATDGDDEVRAVVVTGEGRAFSAGADLSRGGATFDRTAESEESTHRDTGGRIALRIFRSLKPVIAAINGPAVGFGATITLPMDIRLMSESARMGFVFAARGIVVDAAASWFLPRIVGISQALEWCYTGRVFDAREALAGGLVRSLHAPDDLIPTALALAGEISRSGAPLSCVITRQLMWQMLGARHPMEAHRIESRAIHFTGASKDAAEGIRAFVNKEPANWQLAPSRDLPPWFPFGSEPPFAMPPTGATHIAEESDV